MDCKSYPIMICAIIICVTTHRRQVLEGGSGECPLERHLKLRCSNNDIQLLLLPREKKISGYSGKIYLDSINPGMPWS